MRDIRIEASACLWWAVLLLLLPLRWLIAAVTAGAFHECCHYLGIRAMGGNVESIVICHTGASMKTSPLDPRQELICSRAGPIGSLFLILFARFLPMTALCALIQCSFNLLPIYPLDGGRALKCLIALWRPNWDAAAVCSRVGKIGILLLIALTFPLVWLSSLRSGLLFLGTILLYRSFPGKRPCKTVDLALQ